MESTEQLQQRMTELEEKVRRGVQGPRGPAGDIIAATNNAREATREELASALNSLHGLEEQIVSRTRAIIDQAAGAQRKHNENFKAHVEDELAAIILKILHEYHLLDGDNSPTLAADTTALSNRK
jgi:hypothetical protein